MLLPNNHPRILRESTPLFQKDIAFLLGFRDRRQISRLENGDGKAPLYVAFGYQVLFKISPAGLFPRKYKETEEGIRIRAGVLTRELEKLDTDPVTNSRIAALRVIEKGGIARKHPIIFEGMWER